MHHAGKISRGISGEKACSGDGRLDMMLLMHRTSQVVAYSMVVKARYLLQCLAFLFGSAGHSISSISLVLPRAAVVACLDSKSG